MTGCYVGELGENQEEEAGGGGEGRRKEEGAGSFASRRVARADR